MVVCDVCGGFGDVDSRSWRSFRAVRRAGSGQLAVSVHVARAPWAGEDEAD